MGELVGQDSYQEDEESERESCSAQVGSARGSGEKDIPEEDGGQERGGDRPRRRPAAQEQLQDGVGRQPGKEGDGDRGGEGQEQVRRGAQAFGAFQPEGEGEIEETGAEGGGQSEGEGAHAVRILSSRVTATPRLPWALRGTFFL
jgi:hypothetical protein